MTFYDFPWYTSIGWIAGLFVTSLVALHVALVRVLKFDSLQWKQVDYVWVSFALIGIFANVEQVRSTVARNYANLAASRAEASFDRIRGAAQFGASGAVCRTFVRSEFSPSDAELKEAQRQFDAQCEWFKKLVSSLDKISSKRIESIDISKLQASPPSGGEPMAYQHLAESVADFNESARELSTLQEQIRSGWLHELIQVLGPSLLAIAVALRLTKVTGEVRLERARNRGG